MKEEDYSACVPDDGSTRRSSLKLRTKAEKSCRVTVDIQNQNRNHINGTFIDES